MFSRRAVSVYTSTLTIQLSLVITVQDRRQFDTRHGYCLICFTLPSSVDCWYMRKFVVDLIDLPEKECGNGRYLARFY
jgi:hypothetical protein